MVTGSVRSEGEMLSEGPGESRQTLDIDCEQITSQGETYPVQAGLRIGVYSKTAERDGTPLAPPQAFHYGERLRFPSKLYAPRNFRDPGAFDYRGYLAEQGVTLLGSAKADKVEILPGFSGNRWELWRARIHSSMLRRIQGLWPSEEAATVSAMLLGEESFLGRPLREDFQRSGTYHVLVVSGLKVGILALMALWALRRMRVSQPLASVITILLTVGYAALTGAGAPVWRATLMLALYLCARLLYRERSALNTIGAAALALLLIDPAQLLGASFQLSFLCVLIIAGVALPVLERTIHPYLRGLRHLELTGYDASLPPRIAQARLDLRMIAEALGRFTGRRFSMLAIAAGSRGALIASEFLLISVALQVGLALPMAYYFHRANLVALPGNILAVPLTELIMVAAILAVGLAYIWFPLAKIPALLASLALHAINGTVRWLGGLRIADARVPTPEGAVILAAVAALVLAMLLVRRRALLAGAGLAALAASAAWICAVPPHPLFQRGELEVTAIDVGQGDSILLVSPQGRTLLVDAGGMAEWMHSDLDVGEDVVSRYLWSREFSRLDAVAITHAHADHIGGMRAILENFHPRELWLGVDSPSPELQAILREAKALGVRIVEHHEGDAFELGGASIRVLAPELNSVSLGSKANDVSLVMRVGFGATSALLEGDAESAEERRVAEEWPQADLLKVAHHGSATSTIPELLAAVRPQYAVISVGARNVYGHPRREVLERLEESEVATYRTDLDGAVTFYLDGRRVKPQVADLR